MFFYSMNTSSVAEAESYFVGAAEKMLIRIAKNAQKYGVWIENPVLGVSGPVSALSQINFKNFRSLAALLYRIMGTCGLSVTTFFHQVLNYYYLTVYIMFKPKMSLWDLPTILLIHIPQSTPSISNACGDQQNGGTSVIEGQHDKIWRAT